MLNVEGSFKSRTGIAPFHCTDHHLMLKRAEAGHAHIGVALEIPLLVEQAAFPEQHAELAHFERVSSGGRDAGIRPNRR